MNEQDDQFSKMLGLNEGTEFKLYRDSLGFWTIGIGILVSKDKSLTKAQAAKIVSKMIGRPFNADDSLTSAEVKTLFTEYMTA